jgi:hypothetical protein
LLLQKVLSNPGDERVSGKATLIRTAYTRAASKDELLGQKEFKDEQQKQRYLKSIARQAGINLQSSQDVLTSTVEVLYFDGEKKRRDFAKIPPEQAAEIKSNTKVIDSLSFQVYTCTSEKTILRTPTQNEDGEKTNFANIVDGKIYFPKFYSFDHGEKKANIEPHIELLERGLATVSRKEIDNKIQVTFEVNQPQHKFKVERILDKEKNMATLYKATFRNNQLQEEVICSDYERINDGEWYPCKVISNKYIYLNNERVLASSETFETLPGSISFNVQIDDSIFAPELPEGTQVIDDRYNPSLEYKIESPTPEVYMEPLMKSHDQNMTNNIGDNELKNNKADEESSKYYKDRIFIPEINTAIKQSKSYIFDFASKKLIAVYVAKGDEQEQLYNTLIKIGKGDLVWTGSLVTVRNAKIVPVSSKTDENLQYVESKWTSEYKLSPKIHLPYSFILITKEAKKYLVSIHKINPGGIWITCEEAALQP